MFKFMVNAVVSGDVKNELIWSGEVKADWVLEFRDFALRVFGLAFVLDKSANARPVARVMGVGGFLGEIAFSVPVAFLFFSGVSVGGGFRGPTGFFTLPSEGVRTREFSLSVFGLGTRDSLGVAFSLPEVVRTLTTLEVVTGEGAAREGMVALLFVTCAGVVEPLMGSRGTNNGVLTTDLLAPEIVDDSGVLWTSKN